MKVVYFKWECHAQLPESAKFGKIYINCEGYESNVDLYKLVGSCGVTFNLDRFILNFLSTLI